jgi:hypothetical protein
MGKIEYEKPEISISVAAVEERVEAGKVYEGYFTISSTNGLVVQGNLYGSNARIHLLDPVISGTEIQVKFEVDTVGLMSGSVYEGQIYFISNGGEFVVPITLTMLECVIDSSLGKIENYFHFANLVQTNYEEALHLFTSPDFNRIIERNDLQHLGIYEGLRHSVDKQLAMEEFLISIHKKKPVSLSLDKDSVAYTDLKDNYKDVLVLSRSSWGYVNVTVTAEGNFISIMKHKISQDDFAGNRLEFSYFIDVAKLRKGHNFGKIVFRSYDQELVLDVVVHQNVEDRRVREAVVRNIVSANELYLKFRMKQCNITTWTQETLGYMNSINRLDETMLWPYLVKAQVLLSMDRTEEATWLLDNFMKKQFHDAADQLDLYCYYLYVRSLEKREVSFTQAALEEVRRVYDETGSDTALWVILYMDEKYDLNRSLKYTMIKEQFRRGSRSPRLYFEALSVLNEQPRLLRVLNRFELQILRLGAKYGCLSDGLIEQLQELTATERNYNATLTDILKRTYESEPDIKVLTALCSMLIKGNKVGKAYLAYYQAGITADVRLTNLYEYYMLSLPADYEGILPKIIYMYFVYNNEALGEKRSFLFCNIIANKKKLHDIYENYLQCMEQYLVDELLKGHMDRQLAYIYQDILKSATVHSDIARNLTDVVMTNAVQINDERIREVAVIHKELLGETVYKVTDETAYVSLYTEDAILVFIDSMGRRYCNIPYKLEPLLDMHQYLKDVAEFEKSQMNLLLYFAERYIKYRSNPLPEVKWYNMILESSRVRVDFKQELLRQILDYYREDCAGEGLAEYLLKVDFSILDHENAVAVMSMMLEQGLYIPVYQLMKEHGYSKVPVRGVARCLTMLLGEEKIKEEPFFMELCYYVYEKGKYNEEILAHLCEHFNGTVEEMYALWKIAHDFFYENHVLEERILVQTMFTRCEQLNMKPLITSYLNYGVGKQVRNAFYVYVSYLVFMRKVDRVDREALGYVFGYMEEDMIADTKLPRICRVALAEYGARLEQMTDKQKTFYQKLVLDLANRNLIFEFFKRYTRWFELPFFVMDQYYADYRTLPEHQVQIRYTLESQGKITPLLSKSMESVLPGVYVATFVLFYGDRLEYFFNDDDGTNIVTSSRESYEMKNTFVYTDGSRFGMLNDILIAGRQGNDKKQEQLVSDYMEKKTVAESIFYIF